MTNDLGCLRFHVYQLYHPNDTTPSELAWVLLQYSVGGERATNWNTNRPFCSIRIFCRSLNSKYWPDLMLNWSWWGHIPSLKVFLILEREYYFVQLLRSAFLIVEQGCSVPVLWARSGPWQVIWPLGPSHRLKNLAVGVGGVVAPLPCC